MGEMSGLRKEGGRSSLDWPGGYLPGPGKPMYFPASYVLACPYDVASVAHGRGPPEGRVVWVVLTSCDGVPRRHRCGREVMGRRRAAAG